MEARIRKGVCGDGASGQAEWTARHNAALVDHSTSPITGSATTEYSQEAPTSPLRWIGFFGFSDPRTLCRIGVPHAVIGRPTRPGCHPPQRAIFPAFPATRQELDSCSSSFLAKRRGSVAGSRRRLTLKFLRTRTAIASQWWSGRRGAAYSVSRIPALCLPRHFPLRKVGQENAPSSPKLRWQQIVAKSQHRSHPAERAGLPQSGT